MLDNFNIHDAKRLYGEGKSLRDISKIMGTPPRTIGRRLVRFGVVLRGKNAADKEKNSWWQTKEYLTEQYINNGFSTNEIGKIVNAGGRTVATWLENFNIDRRPTGGAYKKGTKVSAEIRKKQSKAKKGKLLGKDNPNWKGGLISDEVRDRRSYQAKRWREECRERDENKCTLCGSIERLHVHHILPYKDYPDRRWDINNGQTVCALCHEKIHQRRFPDWVTGRQTEVKKLKPKYVEKKVIIYPKLHVSKPVLVWLRETLSQTKIAKGFGIGGKTLRNLMEEYGMDTKSKPKFQKPSKEELLRLYPAKTLEEVGEHYIVGQTLVHKWLDEYGIERTKKNRKPRTEEARANMSKARKNRKPVKLKGKHKDCPICGVNFYVSPPRLRQADTHYCNQKCAGKGRTLKALQDNKINRV